MATSSVSVISRFEPFNETTATTGSTAAIVSSASSVDPRARWLTRARRTPAGSSGSRVSVSDGNTRPALLRRLGERFRERRVHEQALDDVGDLEVGGDGEGD